MKNPRKYRPWHSLVIVLLLVSGIYYFFGSKKQHPGLSDHTQTASTVKTKENITKLDPAYAGPFEQLQARGESKGAAKLLVVLYRALPAKEGQFSGLLKRADDQTTREFLLQTGFLKEAGVFPFDLSQLRTLTAADIHTIISNLKSKVMFTDNSELIKALRARGVTLPEPGQSEDFLLGLASAGLDKRDLMINLSNHMKKAPRYTQGLDRVIRQLARDLSDDDLKGFLRDIGYYIAGYNSYDETYPRHIAHFSKETIQTFHDNLDDGDWGVFAFLNFTQRDLVSDLKRVLDKR